MIGRFFNATHDGSTVGPAGPEASSAVNMALVPWKRSNGSAAWAMATVVNAKADRNIFLWKKWKVGTIARMMMIPTIDSDY